MGNSVVRGWSEGRALLLAVLALACASSSAERGPSGVTSQGPGAHRAAAAPRPAPLARRPPAPPTSCPRPSRSSSGYDLAKLALFSKVLFYVREYLPVDLDPRASALVVSALEAVHAQEPEIVVEREPDPRPRWITITVDDQHCTLNIESVAAPWTLRSTLQDAMRFVEANLGPASAAEAKRRGVAIEMALANGMLAGLDDGSRLFDAETYRQIRPRGSNRLNVGGAEAGGGQPPAASTARAVTLEPLSAAIRPGPAGSKIGLLRVGVFAPGVSEAVERALDQFQAEQVKGVVLDLRDNPGGLVDESTKVADAFIKAGLLGTMVTKRERKDLVAHDGGHEPTVALAVLVNQGTASAAELVAAAVKNLGRGVILGERTAGAALVRVYFDVPNGPARLLPEEPDPEELGLQLTIGRLLAAGGGEITGVGVGPDVQPTCPAGVQPGSGDDCLLAFAQSVLAEARDPRRSTLLSAAKTLAR